MKIPIRRGFVIPMVLMLLGLLVMLGSALTQVGTGGLVSTRQSVQTERALALADTGLATAAQKLVTTGALAPPESFPGEGSYVVDKMVNPSTNALPVPSWGVNLPSKSTALRCKGTTTEGTTRTSMAIFRSSIGAFQVGGLADNINGTNSTFDSYDSTLETPGYVPTAIYQVDPVSIVPSSTILASNKNASVVIGMVNSTVAGNAFAGPGSNVAAQISLDATSTVGLTGVLASQIPTPAIVVPTMANGLSSVAPPTTANPATVYLYSSSGVKDTTITPPAKAGGAVTITHYCLTVTIKPDGKYVASESGSGSKIEGDIQDMTCKTLAGSGLSVSSYNPLKIKGQYHQIVYDYANSKFQIDQSGIQSPPPALSSAYSSLPAWIYFSTPPPAALSPATLLPGKYDNVNIQGNMTSLVDGGVYVIKNLTVNALGKIYIGSAFTDTKIFVTGSLTIDGADAIVNDSRKPTALKIYYTGASPVALSGGASAFATLYAPNAWVTLSGFDSGFYGAISAKKLDINNASFHYDVATQGIGTGIDSTTFQLLARYHQ